jgi:hypothetical protein
LQSLQNHYLFRSRHRFSLRQTNQVSIPYLDPSVQHVGISRLRALNVTQLRELDKTLVIQDNETPLAVLLKYEHFLAMQDEDIEERGTVKLLAFRGFSHYPQRVLAAVYRLALVGIELVANTCQSRICVSQSLGSSAITQNRPLIIT